MQLTHILANSQAKLLVLRAEFADATDSLEIAPPSLSVTAAPHCCGVGTRRLLPQCARFYDGERLSGSGCLSVERERKQPVAGCF